MKKIYAKSMMLGLMALLLLAAPALANQFTAVETMNLDGYVSVLVLTQAGTTNLNKIDMKTGAISREAQVKNAPAFNLGILPSAWADENNAQTVILLGPAVGSGGVVKAYALGVLEYTQGGAEKKALVAGMQYSPFDKGKASVEDLDKATQDGIRNWFGANIAGAKVTALKGRLDAVNLTGDAVLAYYFATLTEADRRKMDEGSPTLFYHPLSRNIRLPERGPGIDDVEDSMTGMKIMLVQ